MLKTKATHGLVVGSLLGEGGMGTVHLATQVVLNREVALKQLKSSLQAREHRLDLLREAWITGSLEHPNVVPVYDIAMDDAGGPAIVLKRIEGVAWADVMHDSDAIRSRFGASDPLEWNLRTLTTVANALAFAHERGIVHRDLKPENVMLGRFGEVYVVDWGIAVSTRGDDERLPQASLATAMAGTPSYMAPEMLGDSAETIGPHCDVYLLGATLHEILTGNPPHKGNSLIEIFGSVVRSEFEFDERIPEEIAAVCRRALARSPADRFPTATAFRVAIDDFLQHRVSYALAEAADRNRERLEAARGQGAAPEELHALFGECRFAYRAALQAWGGNRSARRSLDTLLCEGAEYELRNRKPDAAALLLAEAVERPADLVARVQKAVVEADRELKHFGQLALDNDASIGRTTRLVIMATLGTLWTGGPVVSYLYPPIVTPLSVLLSLIAVLVFAAGFCVWARDSLMTTKLNQRLASTLLAVLVFQVLVALAVYVADVPLSVFLPLLPALYTMTSATLVVWLEGRTWPATLVGMGATIVALTKPEWIFLGIAAYTIVQTLAIVAVWREQEQPASRVDASSPVAT